MARKSKGRQRVEMVKMNNESNLQVTFSKRRTGLFKKASELCTLCGAEVAIIVFSPGRKVFSFGHPCVETIVERFLSRNPQPQQTSSGTMQLIEAHRNATVRELNAQLTQVLSQLEAEKKRGEEINQFRKANRGNNWWESPIEDLNIPQLDQLKGALEDLKKNVANQAEKLLIQSAAPHHFYVGGSSNPGGINPFDHKKPLGFNPNMTPYGYNPGFRPACNPVYKPEYNPTYIPEYNSVYKSEFNQEYKPDFNQGYNPGYGPPGYH